MKFKHDTDKDMFYLLHPCLIWIYADLAFYAFEKHNVELTITSTVSTPEIDRRLQRVSSSHLTRRAIDIRTKDLDAKIVNDLIDYINNKQDYKRFHYESRTGKKRLAYFHNNHLHVAIHARYSLPPISKTE